MGTWHEPTEREAVEHLCDVLAAEVADDWLLPTAFLYPADGVTRALKAPFQAERNPYAVPPRTREPG